MTQPKSAMKARPSSGPSSAVSLMHSAPVTIGNSICGVKPKVQNIPGGVRVTGRDYIFSTTQTASTDWTLIGGLPLTPAAMYGSAIQNYVRMYGSWKLVAAAFHFITAAATTNAGEVLLYTQKTHSDPMVNWASTAFVPFVLSDPGTVMGPVWMNHTSVYKPEDSWRSTDYLNGDDLNDEAAGDIYCFQKGPTATQSYVLMDYIFEFKELSANPKRGLLPLERTAWFNTSLGKNGANVTSGTTTFQLNVFGNNLSGQAAKDPTGASLGDIYKVIVDSTNSSYGSATTANLVVLKYPSGQGVTIVNGFTCYALLDSVTTTYSLFPSLSFARAGVNNFVYGLTNGSLTFNLQCWLTLIDGTEVQSSL